MARALRRATAFSSFVLTQSRHQIAGARSDLPPRTKCTCAEAAFGTRLRFAAVCYHPHSICSS